MPKTKSPLRVVIDSTVLVSAFITPGGLSNEILRFARLEIFEFLSSEDIFEETCLTLLRKAHIRRRYFYPDEDISDFISGLRQACTIVANPPTISVIKQDPKDDKILACAIAVPKADYIISRDTHLLDLKAYRGIKIIKPEEFIGILRKRT